MTRKTPKRIGWYLSAAVLVAFGVTSVFPIFWMVLASLKSAIEIWNRPPLFFFTPNFSSYTDLFGPDINYQKFLANSLIIAVGTSALSVTLGSMAAYAFTRGKFWGSKSLQMWFLSLKFLPSIVIIFPLFLEYRYFGLMDTQLGVILAHSTFLIPFSLWLMKAYLQDLPKAIDEAAMVDGASRLETFRKIILPLVAPGMAVTAAFCFVFSWNEFIIAYILTSNSAVTAPTRLTQFRGLEAIDWPHLFSAEVVSLIPLFIMFLILQRFLVRGLSLGAVKG